MPSKEKYEEAARLLTAHGQDHLLAFHDQLEEPQKQQLLEQIDRLDFSQIPAWITDYVKKAQPPTVPAHFGPAPSYSPTPQSPAEQEKYDQARKLGTELISAGKVAAFVVAGGQGTRLGFDGPKGNFPLSPVKNKTLFQIFAETILAAGKKYDANLCWYIMTSPLNHRATCEIFKSNGYYDLAQSDVCIFQQGTLPNFAFDGKIFLADKSSIASSPDGHGGSLKALYDSGASADMKARGIEYISYWQVDNPLVNIFDPLFVGMHAIDNAQMSSKALVKSGPTEKVGNFCFVDGKVTVIEYIDLPDAHAHKQNPDGSLVFELGSIGIHIISTGFVEKLNSRGFALPIHRAVKKIPHIDTAGKSVEPAEPNGVKLETFVFDALPLASNSVILQTERSEEFAPVKNATGQDSADVTRRMMVDRAAGWLEYAGVGVPRKTDGSVDCVIEIAPSFGLSPEDVKAKKDGIPAITTGGELYLQ
ncbi:MAG: UTP--glucose-1-phosphate uridylyltransferase [Planctomycetota bacterium]